MDSLENNALWPVSSNLSLDENVLVPMRHADERYKEGAFEAAAEFYTLALQMYQPIRNENILLFAKMLCKRLLCFIELSRLRAEVRPSVPLHQKMKERRTSTNNCSLLLKGMFEQAHMEIEKVNLLICLVYPRLLPAVAEFRILALERQGKIIEAFIIVITMRNIFPTGKFMDTQKRQCDKLRDLIDKSDDLGKSIMQCLLEEGKVFFVNGMLHLAMLLFTEILSVFDFRFAEEAHLYRAMCYMEMGRLKEAEDDVDTVISRRSENSTVAKALQVEISVMKEYIDKQRETVQIHVENAEPDEQKSSKPRKSSSKKGPAKKPKMILKTKRERKEELRRDRLEEQQASQDDAADHKAETPNPESAQSDHGRRTSNLPDYDVLAAMDANKKSSKLRKDSNTSETATSDLWDTMHGRHQYGRSQHSKTTSFFRPSQSLNDLSQVGRSSRSSSCSSTHSEVVSCGKPSGKRSKTLTLKTKPSHSKTELESDINWSSLPEPTPKETNTSPKRSRTDGNGKGSGVTPPRHEIPRSPLQIIEAIPFALRMQGDDNASGGLHTSSSSEMDLDRDLKENTNASALKAVSDITNSLHQQDKAKFSLPSGVIVACDHAIQNSKTNKDIEPCSGCQRNGLTKYVFWSDDSSEWKVVRCLPDSACGSEGFQLCKAFHNGTNCLEDSCSMAHGPLELLMWRKEREGGLPRPATKETTTSETKSEEIKSRLTIDSLTRTGIRPPPESIRNGDYKLCKWFRGQSKVVCRVGRDCPSAHGQQELSKWKKDYDEKQKEKGFGSCGDSTSEVIVNRRPSDIQTMESPQGIEVSSLPKCLKIVLDEDLEDHAYGWTFVVRYNEKENRLRRVYLSDQPHSCYSLTNVIICECRSAVGRQVYDVRHRSTLDALHYNLPSLKPKGTGNMKVEIKVSFNTTVFGSFHQSILFDFGKKHMLVKRFNVDVARKEVLETLSTVRQDIVPDQPEWDNEEREIVRFATCPEAAARQEILLSKYSLPKYSDFISAEMITENLGTDARSYSSKVHQLLFVEEVYMRQQLSRFNLLNASLECKKHISKEGTGMEIARENELYGVIKLETPITPENSAGRLCTRKVHSMLLQSTLGNSKRMYETPIHSFDGEESVTLRLSPTACTELEAHDGAFIKVDARFQLNRVPLCEMHQAVDRIGPGHLEQLFPSPQPIRKNTEINDRWNWLLDEKLNDNQKNVIQAIVDVQPESPPLVVFGPFGTGKTFTLNQSVWHLIRDTCNRVLLCTHTNKAADIHVELLDKYLNKNGIQAARPLRIYESTRRITTTSEIARKYALIKDGVFQVPTRADVIEHRVIITTLTASQVLTDLKFNHGFFTHILVDEAAQAWEPEALIPIALAGPNTRLVLTGDHMQIRPEVYSKHANEWGLRRSLPQRLMDHYSNMDEEEFKNANVMFLNENYRSNKDILDFPSYHFYGNKLKSPGHDNNPAHPRLGSILFFTAKGRDEIQHDNTYLNSAEVYEVVKRVEALANDWPTCWGERDLKEIAVLAGYQYQVRAIRDVLKRSRHQLRDVTVDTIHNVQGQEFRALFISTVRTVHTAKRLEEAHRGTGSSDPLYFEFLSDPSLLNTAVTRAKSLVAVVGDPVSLCTVGECRNLWRDYIRRCDKRGGLYGTTIKELNCEIDKLISGVSLNPDATPFLPKGNVPADTNSNGQLQDHHLKDDYNAGNNSTDVTLDMGNNDAIKEESSINYNIPEDAMYLRDSEERQWQVSDDAVLPLEGTPAAEGEETTQGDAGDAEDLEVELLDDDTILPEFMDDIIKAFIMSCDAKRVEVQSSNLQSLTSRNTGQRSSSLISSSQQKLLEDSPSDYNMKMVNGRVVINLVLPGLHQTQSLRSHRPALFANRQESIDPDLLKRLLNGDPLRYIACQLRIGADRYKTAYAEVSDTRTPDILIKGRVRHAFDRDTVVVDLGNERDTTGVGRNARQRGTIVGVLQRVISPHERQYVCMADFDSPSLFIPINKSATKLVNLSDRHAKDMPIYKKGATDSDSPIRVDLMKRKDVLNGKHVFVVQFLQWRPDCVFPLGMVVKVLPIGDTFKRSMEILYHEYGVRRSFRKEIRNEVESTYPHSWTISDEEVSSRPKVTTAFTIDPPDSKDLDDALSVEKLPNNIFKVGIHIADVSYFVLPNTALDREACKRCTSFYPGNGEENVPMLPRSLSEHLCSLLPNEDRLTVSVFLQLNSDGKVVTEGEPEIRRTILRSCCRLAYSEAQAVIDSKDNLSQAIPFHVQEDIRVLNSLSQKRRQLRLGDAALDQTTGRDSPQERAAHELVEEMMILANRTVGSFVFKKHPNLAPLRTQLPPKKFRLTEWAEKYGSIAQCSLFMKRQLEALDEDITIKSKEMEVQATVWAEICKTAEEEDFVKLAALVCNDNNHPQLATAHMQLNRIQSQAQYVCAGEQKLDNLSHFSLDMRYYTHFTSPIRRYVDILVHRIVLSSLSGKGTEYDMEGVSKICRRSTVIHHNAKTFERECNRASFAGELKRSSHGTTTVIDSINKESFTIHVINPDDDHLTTRQKTIRFDHLTPTTKTDGEDGLQSTALVWRFRLYMGPSEGRNDKKPHYRGKAYETNYDSSMSSQNTDTFDQARDVRKDAATLQKIVDNDFTSKGEAVLVKADCWMKIVYALKAENSSALNEQLQEANRYRRSEKQSHSQHVSKRKTKEVDIYQHMYEKSLRLTRYDDVRIQLSTHVIDGILSPEVQLLKISPNLCICVEHRKYPRECFAMTAKHNASRKIYNTIKEYVYAWKQVLAMEAAAGAISQEDSFTIKELKVKWSEKEEDQTTAQFVLSKEYCESRDIHFYTGDFVCVKVRYDYCQSPEDESLLKPQGIATDRVLLSGRDAAASSKVVDAAKEAIVDGQNHEAEWLKKYPDNPQKGIAEDFWVGHCIISRSVCVHVNQAIDVVLHHCSSDLPRGLLDGEYHTCDMEVIHRALPHRRMYLALDEQLDESSPLVHAICKGKSPPVGKSGKAPVKSLSIAESHPKSGYQPLNKHQEEAVRKALSQPFTLIQGPPGTGKTMTGVHIAYWFADTNRQRVHFRANQQVYKGTNTGKTKIAKAPPQVLYCGPSNKSVDVVTKYLLQIPNVKERILRVHGDLIEQLEFPVPNKLKPVKKTKSDEELKIPSDDIKEVSLHHLIRLIDSPFATELKKMEKMFEEKRENQEKPIDNDVKKYLELVSTAESWVIMNSGRDIILCTCAAAGSSCITTSCNNVMQCIVDECGMCMEPETLIPITCSKASQIVLIGDHKQLQPIINDNMAKKLGLGVSMFERLADESLMLKVQYRMHEGICEFPSNQFYEGKLETAAQVVKARKQGPIKGWPSIGKGDSPIVFCHVEGEEDSSAIATERSGVDSKSNTKEAMKAVQVAKYLVNGHGGKIKQKQVVILTPYREQRANIAKQLKDTYEAIQVTTVIKSQGSEWDYVILSLVRSMPKEEIDSESSLQWLRKHLGFVTDEHQINVALTRARKGLCIIGNKNLLSVDTMWRSLLEHYEKRNCVVDESWPGK